MKGLSQTANSLIGQPMFALLHQVQEMESQGRTIFHFEIGDPDFDSPHSAKEGLKRAIDQNLTHYTNSMGLLEFREAIAEYTLSGWGFKPDINQILVCPANAVIDSVIRCVCNQGDEVLYQDPGFPTYHSAISYNGVKPIGVPLTEKNNFRLCPSDLVDRISDRSRLIILNSPQNPTGAMIKQKDVLKIAQIAKERDLYLLSDEVYSKITYGEKHFSPSIVDQCKERTILLNSLSKTFSMAGWRVGYAIGPKELIAKMGLLLQTTMSCLPAFTQAGAMAVLTEEIDILKERITILKDRRDLLVEGLNKLKGISCLPPEGSFYVFCSIKDTGMTSKEYCKKLLHEFGVCLLPGDCFGKFGEGYVRLCYASTNIEVIKQSLEKMNQFHLKYVKS